MKVSLFVEALAISIGNVLGGGSLRKQLAAEQLPAQGFR